jgi:ferredoxin
MRDDGGMRLRVNPIACTGHGMCAELLPELIGLDRWGYPLVADGAVPHHLAEHARRAVAACPTLALLIEQAPARGSLDGSFVVAARRRGGRHSG